MLRRERQAIRQVLFRHAVDLVLVGVCCLLVFSGAAWVSESVFERLPHTEDESAFLFQAQTIASGRIVADAPEVPEPFGIPFIIVRDGMWFGKYPPGFPMVLALGVFAGAPWVVNALTAALCVVLAYLLARYFYDRNTARFAAVLLAASPFLLLQAGSLLSHVVSLFWTLLFILLFSMAVRQQGAALPLAAGGAFGMLFLTRPLTAVGVAIPFAIWAVVSIVRRGNIHRSYLWMAAAAIPFLVGYLAYNDLTTGSPFRTAYELWWPFDRIGFGPDKGINGHDLDDGIRNTKLNADSLASYLFGWPGRLSLVPAFAAVAVSLLVLAVRAVLPRLRRPLRERPGDGSPEQHDLLLAGVVLGIVGVHIFYWTPGQMYGPRYFMEAIGPLAILTARCAEQFRLAIGTLVERFGRGRQPATLGIITVLVVLVAYGHLAWAPGEYDRFRGWNGITGDDLAVVEGHDLSNAVVIVGREEWIDYAPFFTRNRPALDTDIVYASDRGAAMTAALMEHYPGRSFYYYVDGEISRLR